MLSILVDEKIVDLKECAYGFPWHHDANCFNFKAPTEFILSENINNIANPLDVTTLVLGCDMDDYGFISKMSNLRQLYIYAGSNLVDLDFIRELTNLNQICIKESRISSLNALVEMLNAKKNIIENLQGIDKILFYMEAICIKSSEELEGDQLLVKGMTASEIIVNGKWITR